MNEIWAIARVTILQIMRRVSSLFLIVLFGAGAVFLALNVEGDNTLTGQLRVLLRWSQTFVSVGLMLLTVYLASTALSSEFANKQMFMLDVKPVRRWQMIVGKWIGVSAVIVWLQLIMASTVLCTMTMTVVNASRYAGTEDTIDRVLDLDRVHREVFVSRQSVRPTLVNYQTRIDQRIKELVTQGSITEEEAKSPELREWIKQGISLKLMTLNPMDSQQLSFKNLAVPTDPNATFVVRYKFFGRSSLHDVKFLNHEWTFTNNTTGESWRDRTSSREGQINEMVLSCEMIGADGSLTITVKNLAKPTPNDISAGVKLIIPAIDGVEVLVPNGSFLGNFIRGQLLLTIRLLMICLIGISLSPAMRAQVIAFALIGLLVAGSLNNFLADATKPEVKTYAEIQQQLRNPELAHDDVPTAIPAPIMNVFLTVLPNFQNSSAVSDWSVGREIPLSHVLWQFLTDLILRGGVIFAYGIYMFNRRETGIPVFD